MSDDPFPDLGKVVLACQRAMPSRGEYTSHRDESKVNAGTLIEVAKALELEI